MVLMYSFRFSEYCYAAEFWQVVENLTFNREIFS